MPKRLIGSHELPCAAPAGSRAALPRTLALAALALMLSAAGVRAEPACPDAFVPGAAVAAVDSGGDLVLADGAVLRLAGISLGAADGEEKARAALQELAVGREVTIASADGAKDRYGRLAAMVRVAGTQETLQSALLGGGLALVQPEKGWAACMPVLLAAEKPARLKRRGIWAELPLDARNVAAISRRQGRFTIVTGRVLSVGNGRAVSYLNFGPVWRQDMTGRLHRSASATLEARGMSVADLAGRRVTLRGTVLEAGGPAIELSAAEQVEWEEIASVGSAGDGVADVGLAGETLAEDGAEAKQAGDR